MTSYLKFSKKILYYIGLLKFKVNKFKTLSLVSESLISTTDQMTLIWLFKVTKGQTDCAIRFAIYKLL